MPDLTRCLMYKFLLNTCFESLNLGSNKGHHYPMLPNIYLISHQNWRFIIKQTRRNLFFQSSFKITTFFLWLQKLSESSILSFMDVSQFEFRCKVNLSIIMPLEKVGLSLSNWKVPGNANLTGNSKDIALSFIGHSHLRAPANKHELHFQRRKNQKRKKRY